MLYHTLKKLSNTEKNLPFKSKGLSDEKHTIPTTTDDSLTPSINWYEDSNSKNFV